MRAKVGHTVRVSRRWVGRATAALAALRRARGSREARLKPPFVTPFPQLQPEPMEAVMDDGRQDEAGTPRERKHVTEHELYRVLDESLWQVERRRVDPEHGKETS